jgi:hypothetical protein
MGGPVVVTRAIPPTAARAGKLASVTVTEVPPGGGAVGLLSPPPQAARNAPTAARVPVATKSRREHELQPDMQISGV